MVSFSQYFLCLYYTVSLSDSIRPYVRNSVSSCSAIPRNPPPLQWNYPSLQSYEDFPTACNPFVLLLSLSDIPLMHYWYFFVISDMETTGSLQLTQCHCITWLTWDPVVLCIFSPKRPIHVLPSVMSKTSAHQFTIFRGWNALWPYYPAVYA